MDVVEEAAAGSGGNDEGRAMLQIVHDLAPEAKLAFATAFGGEEAFARNIEKLAAPVVAGGAGADVIVDDVSYLEEPFFQDGPIADAIAKVSAEGVTYLSAAGNDNLFEGENEIASWEAPAYRDSGGCPTAIQPVPRFRPLEVDGKGRPYRDGHPEGAVGVGTGCGAGSGVAAPDPSHRNSG
ncbi:MAG TPA: hypothetical protein VGC32_21655 [Solirubrobacterales bacterium]